MVVKFLVFILSIFFISPVYAGIYEDAVKTNENVLLYLTWSDCRYCKKFDPIYNNLYKKYSNQCKFVKVDVVSSAYGRQLFDKFHASGVPFVLFVKKGQQGVKIPTSCLLNYSCIDNKISKFLK